MFRWRGSDYGLQPQGKLVMSSKKVDKIRLAVRSPDISTQ